MSLLSDYIIDGALERLQEADELWILSGADEPADYTAALAVRCGIKDAPVVGDPVDGTVSGRKVVVSAFNDGTPTVAAPATRWCLVDTVGERLLTCRLLSGPKALVLGDDFVLGNLEIEIPDPAAEV
jgi:hypothetical protein